jgi:hydrogenase maturation factor
MSYSTNYTKKELEEKLREKDDLISQLKEKLVEMKGVEKQVTADAQKYSENALGLCRNEKGEYLLVKVGYDPVSKAATVITAEVVGKDAQIAIYQAKNVLVNDIYLPLIDSKFKS